MGNFLQDEKPLQTAFKVYSPYFSTEARAEGIYKGHSYPFCLPRAFAHENLFPGIRETILSYFNRHGIKWHDGQDGQPSNHLCDSQVCCANFLFPFFDKPSALADIIRPVFPDLEELLPIEDGQYVAFEWIGEQNYLCEKISSNDKRTRGANFTSADAAVMFRHKNGQKQIVLIEWKYTESYSPTWLKYAASGTDRTKIYEHLYRNDDCPLDKEIIPNFDDLFFEPFYQLMRQQFLAREMEKAHELGADIVSLLHISPAHNKDFMRVTSPGLQRIDISPTKIWKKLMKYSNRFTGEYAENIFCNVDVQKYPEIKDWWHYVSTRYTWITN